MSLASDVLALVRTELRSTNDGKPWSNSQLYTYINEVVQRLSEVIASEVPGSGWFKHEEDVTIAANTETKNLAAAGVLAYSFAGLLALTHKLSSGEYVPVTKIPPGAEAHWLRTSLVSPNEPRGFFLRQLGAAAGVRLVNLHVRPLANDTTTLRVAYRFSPAVLVAADTMPFVAKWDRLVALETAKKALAADGTSEKKWDEELRTLYVAFLNDCSSQGGSDMSEGVKEVVGAYLFD